VVSEESRKKTSGVWLLVRAACFSRLSSLTDGFAVAGL
jgi:hypothetical protein